MSVAARRIIKLAVHTVVPIDLSRVFFILFDMLPRHLLSIFTHSTLTSAVIVSRTLNVVNKDLSPDGFTRSYELLIRLLSILICSTLL